MRKAICLLAAFVLLATSLAAATSQVNNITLSHQNGHTSARINVEGTVRFSHQTEGVKDGKPFRIIVDILKATHHLGAKKFMSLPKCAVSAIRTSQYAVKPEAVVRVVFDMTQEATYRVESNQNAVTVVFPDKGGQRFASWSTSAVVAALIKAKPRTTVAAKAESKPTPKSTEPTTSRKKTPAEVNSEIDRDRMASLASKDQPKAVKPAPLKSESKSTTPKVVARVKKPTSKEVAQTPKPTKKSSLLPTSTYTPGSGQYTDHDKWADLYKNTPPPVKKTKVAEVKPTKVSPTLAATDQPTASVKKPVKADSKTVAKVDRPKGSSKSGVIIPTPGENKLKVTKKTDGKTDSKTVAKVDKPAKDKKSTSRFRRSPSASRKIKGTMVAEFPKRLVVKYKTKHYRDPFATLINEAQVTNSPIEQKVPNVEGLRLVGVLESEGGKNSVLLEDANGYGYILKTGDRVRKGYVLRIQSDRVYFQIFEYGWSRTLALHLEE
jgi:hypothetical protein